MSVNPFRPQRISALTSAARKRSWAVELLDREERSLGFTGSAAAVGDRYGVTGWTVEANANSQAGLSGSLSVFGPLTIGGIEVDWSIHRIRIWETVAGVGTWPLGVLLPVLPSPSHKWRDTSWNVELIGKLRTIGRDRLTQSWAAGPGTPVTSHITNWLQSIGEYNFAVTPATDQLTSQIIWPSGTSKLTMLNEMASAIGYRGLRADPSGTIISEKYTAPKDRTVSWEFTTNPDSTLLTPEWEEEWNLDAPNVFLARSQEQDDGVTWEAIAEDWDQDRPSSISRRGGQRVTEVADSVEVASAAALQAYANQRLSELVAPAERLTVSHLTVPTIDLEGAEAEGLWVEDVVRHVRPGHDIMAVVETMSWSSDSPLCTATWRRV